MSYTSLLSQTLTIIRKSQAGWTTDDDGNPLLDAPDETTARGLIQQQETREIEAGPDTFTTTHRLFLEADVNISGWDQVSDGGRFFEVLGDPDRITNPRRGTVDHIEADLRAVTVEGPGNGS